MMYYIHSESMTHQEDKSGEKGGIIHMVFRIFICMLLKRYAKKIKNQAYMKDDKSHIF